MLVEFVAVDKSGNDKRGDADALRAGDIVPPYNKKNRPSENITPPVDEKKAEQAGDEPAEAADVEHKEGEIPNFDLAKQILAEQRRITAIKRKAPVKAGPVKDPKDKGLKGVGIRSGVAGLGKKAQILSRESGTESISYAVKQPLVLAEQEQIIAEIVTRDIERLCGRLNA